MCDVCQEPLEKGDGEKIDKEQGPETRLAITTGKLAAATPASGIDIEKSTSDGRQLERDPQVA